MYAVNARKIGHKGKTRLSGSALFALLAASVSVHAGGYTQTNLVASTDAYGVSIIDPTLINAWGIAIRPAGFGGHFWMESNGGGTSNQFIGDVGGTPLYSDDLRLVTVPGPTAGGPAVPIGTSTGVGVQPRYTIQDNAGIHHRTGKVHFCDR